MKKWNLLFIILFCNTGFIWGHLITHVTGHKLILDCRSISRVHCVWKFNSRFFKFSKRHSYLLGDGTNTMDCSLEIKPFLEIDAGNWSCWSLSDNLQDGQLLNFSSVALDNNYHKKIINPFPRNVTSNGDDVILPCLFNERIFKCNWYRNGDPVVIRNRYRYTNNAEGHYSTDCSIEISKVHDIDLGIWQCSSTSNDRIGYVQSEPALLDASDPRPSPIHQIPVVEEHPANQTTKMEDQITMSCKFNQPVHCAWLRNGQALEIHYKFQYLDKNNGKSVNCSISISNINALDFGSWQCLSVADDKMPAVKSGEAFLIDGDIAEEINVQIIEGPENTTSAPGHNVYLMCKFDKNVYCIWQRNGNAVLIDHRYHYVSKENGVNTTDCSIRIEYVANADFGRWTCGFLASQENSNTLFREAALQQMKLPSFPKIRIGMEFLEEIELFSWDPSLPKNITCFSSNGYPAANLSWVLNGQQFSGNILQKFDERQHSYDTILEWSDSHGIEILQNSTELHCIAEHPFFNKTMFASVRIRKTKIPSSPVIIQDGQEINILRGLTGDTVTCTSLEGHPAPKLYWLFDGQQITGFAEYQSLGKSNLFNTTLHWNATLNNMMFSKDATINCVAEHPDFSQPLKAVLRIKPFAKPVIQLHGTFITTLEMKRINESSALICVSESGKYEPNMHWECDGEKVGLNFQNTIRNGTTSILFWNATFDQYSLICERSLDCVAEYWFMNFTLKSSINITQDIPDNETLNMGRGLLLGIFTPFIFGVVLIVTLVVFYCSKRYHGRVYFKYIINADQKRTSKTNDAELKGGSAELHGKEKIQDVQFSETFYV